MLTFDEAYKEIGVNEGGFANHPSDAGGMTYAGIASKYHPNWTGWQKVRAGVAKWGGNVKALNTELRADADLQSLVKEFYYTEFWKRSRAGEIAFAPLAMSYFDMCVNAGLTDGARYLQKGCNLLGASLTEDGIIGPNTLKAVNAQAPERITQVFIAYRGKHYIEQAEKKPSQRAFIAGWLKRLFRNGVPV